MASTRGSAQEGPPRLGGRTAEGRRRNLRTDLVGSGQAVRLAIAQVATEAVRTARQPLHGGHAGDEEAEVLAGAARAAGRIAARGRAPARVATRGPAAGAEPPVAVPPVALPPVLVALPPVALPPIAIPPVRVAGAAGRAASGGAATRAVGGSAPGCAHRSLAGGAAHHCTGAQATGQRDWTILATYRHVRPPMSDRNRSLQSG